MRTSPEVPPPVQLKQDPGTTVQIRKYRLITPLFGGGVEPGKPDEEQPVSGKAVRGHLRFWWRATQGGLYPSVADLKRAEDECWGATNKPSPVDVLLVSFESETRKHAFKGRWRRNQRGQPAWQVQSDDAVAPGYAAFPLRPKEDESRKPDASVSGRETPWVDYGPVLQGVTFTLKLRYPDGLQDEVEAALWAWETFGGVGARTRRGFGALRLVEVDDAKQVIADARAHVLAGLGRHVVGGTWPDGIPHLSRSMQFKITGLPWQALIKKLQDFRQDRNPGAAHNAPGRSRWPEPDAIRRISGRWSHKRGHNPVHPVVNKFPRAVFGLPIIFHFKDGLKGPGDPADGDPYDTTLQGVERDRLASPLILRPLHHAGGTVGLAAILELQGPRTPPGGLILKDASGNPPVQSDLTPVEAGHIAPLGGRSDVLQAFLNSLP